MASSITRFDIRKYDVKNGFGLWNIKIRALMIEDEDQALMLLMSLPSSYKNFVEALLYRKESLTIEDVLATLNSKELKKRTKGTKEEFGNGLYVRGRSDHSGKAHSGRSLRFKSRGGTGKLKCFICHLEGHLKRDCPMNMLSGFVRKGKHDQDSDSFDKEGNTYFGEVLVVVRNDEMTELVMDLGGSYHMTHKRNFLYDFKDIDGGSVRLGDNRTCIIKGAKKVKIQLNDGPRFKLKNVRYVPRLRRSLISFCTLEKEGYTIKMQMGGIKESMEYHLINVFSLRWNCKDLKGIRESEVFQVSNDDAAVAQRRLEDKKLEEKTNTD
ncbi:retrovirus-related pol polyprotein from transposon TNT 1-94 [Tanacetum coccineum]